MLVKMVIVIEYVNNKKYVKDMKTGRKWRVLEKGKISKKGKEGERLKTEKRKKKRFHPGTVALWEIRKFQKTTGFLIRKQEISLCKVGEGNCTGTKGWPLIPGTSSAGFSEGSGGLCGKSFWRCKFMHHTCKEGHTDAQGNPVDLTDLGDMVKCLQV